MTRVCAVLALLLVVGCNDHADKRFEDQARADLVRIDAGLCAPVAAEFASVVATRLDAGGLCRAFATYEAEFGTYRSAGTATSVQRGAITVVQVPLRLTKGAGEYRVSYDVDGKIVGIYFLRAGVPLGG
ncbi:MAG: hypothetical protein ABIO67_08685 [Mycobacteriales bacterium]